MRFVLAGRGLFFFHPGDGPVLRLEIEAGDFVRVPAGVKHWFDLCADRTLRAIRFVHAQADGAPDYVADGVHEHYEPACWSPGELAGISVSYDWVMQA